MTARSRPNVVLLIADSLRADAVSCHGGSTQTPRIDELASEGVVFDNAYAAGPGTTISHGALFSGQYPSETGMYDSIARELDTDVPTLAAHLSDHGYDTFGIAGPSGMSSEVGYDRGFDDFIEPHRDVPNILSTDFFKKALAEKRFRKPFVSEFFRRAIYGPDKYTNLKFEVLRGELSKDRSNPLFALVNFLTAHRPYDAPRPWKEEATPSLSRPPYYFLERLLGSEESLDRSDIRTDRVFNAETADGIARYMSDDDYLSEAELDVLRDWYDASVRYFDDRLGTFLDRLREQGVYDDTIFILTADHGEFFGEHGLLVHNQYTFEEVLHVPLVVAGPGVPEGERYDGFVSLVDLFATVCDLLDIEPPTEVSGASVFDKESSRYVCSEQGIQAVLGTADASGKRKYMSRGQLEDISIGRKAIRTEDYLLVSRSDGSVSLYDRSDDLRDSPREREISDPAPDVVSRLEERLSETLDPEFEWSAPESSEDLDLDQSTLNDLRELGYIE